MSGCVEGAGGTGRFPRNFILGVGGHLRAAHVEACLKEGVPQGKHGFPCGSEHQASDVA
jgi:hypothetical protein